VTLFKSNSNPLGGGQFSVNGQRTSANYFMVDGVSANTAITTGTGSFAGQSASGQLPGLTSLGSTQSLVSIDALQEFRVQTSTYAPEFGRTPGGQISMVTRSGANEFHGTLSEYFRNEIMDATDWFANANRQPKPPERQHNFGGTFGGPVLAPRFGEGGSQPGYDGRNRTFFFVSYEGLRLRLPQSKVVGVPTLALRSQVPAAGRTLFNAFPLPNGADLGGGIAQFAASYADPSEFNTTSVRIDHSIKDKITIFGRYSHAPSISRTRTSSLNTISQNDFQNDSLTMSMTWILSGDVTNDLRGNWTRTRAKQSREVDGFGGGVAPPNSVMFTAPLTPDNAFFLFSLDGTSGFGLGTGNDNFQKQWNVIDGLTWVKGAHTMKFGVDYRRISPTLSAAGGDFNNLLFGPVANALAGTLQLAQIARGADKSIGLYTNLSAYAQDSWKITPRLSLNYGLRWELNPPPSSPNGHLPLTVMNILAPEPLSFAPANTALWKTTYNNFAPRVGASYRVSQGGAHELVVRGGFGVFYDTGFGVSAIAFDHIYPFFASKVVSSVPYPLTADAAKPPVPGVETAQQLWITDRNLKLPYTLQWNVSVEQAVGTKQSLTVSYVGAAGKRLLRRENYNVLFTQFGATRIPIFYSTNAGTSDYKALQVQFQRRLSQGLQAIANYTLSSSHDIISDDSAFLGTAVPGSFVDISREYGPSDFDVRHVGTGGVTYDLPKLSGKGWAGAVIGNWGIDGMLRVRTAFPLTVITSVPFSTGTLQVRPSLVPNAPLKLFGAQYPGGWILNRAALVTPATGTVGDFPRNSVRGFPAQQVDLTVRRQFDLTERIKFQLRFEVFNVFNHPNFSDPNVSLTGSNFGISTQSLNRGLGSLNALYQMGGPRSGQIAAKITF
jgi:hypothetical protein